MLTRSPLAAPAGPRRRLDRPASARTRTATALVGALVAFVALAAPVAAHSDDGEMEITRLESTSAQTISIEVGIRYANDGHLAEDAEVQARAIGPDGTSIGPVELTRVTQDGALYAAELTGAGPGSWTVQADSTDPVADASGTVEVTAQPEGGDEDAPTETPAAAGDAAPTTSIAASGAGELIPLDADPMASGDDLEGGLPFVAFLGAVAAVAITGGALTVVRRRENAARAADPTPTD